MEHTDTNGLPASEVADVIADDVRHEATSPESPRDFSADVVERTLAAQTPTQQELWQLAQTQGFEQPESILQIKPDRSSPYCAAVCALFRPWSAP